MQTIAVIVRMRILVLDLSHLTRVYDHLLKVDKANGLNAVGSIHVTYIRTQTGTAMPYNALQMQDIEYTRGPKRPMLRHSVHIYTRSYRSQKSFRAFNAANSEHEGPYLLKLKLSLFCFLFYIPS